MNVPTTNARLYLIRHGETAWSLNGRHTGRSDIPLTGHGEQQCRVLAQRLGDIQVDRVLCSPRLRTRRTCELLGWGGVMEIEPDLAEWDYGEYEGLISVDIRANRPDWDLFRDGCPGGESPADVSVRADRVIARLRAWPGHTAVCSHGHFGRVLAARWIGASAEKARPFLLSAASLSVLGYEHNRIDMPAIVLWNVVPDAEP